MTPLVRRTCGVLVAASTMSAALWLWTSSGSDAVSPSPEPLPPPFAAAPPPLARVEAAVAVRSTPAFRLVGTVVSPGGTGNLAFVRRVSDARVLQVRTGDRIDGLTVDAIAAHAVVLAGAGESIVVEAGRSDAPPAPPVAVLPPIPPVEPAWAGDPEPFGH